MIKNICFFLIAFILISLTQLHAQTNFSLKLTTVSYFFIQDKNQALFTNKFVDNLDVLYEPGLVLSFEQFIKDDYVSLKLVDGIYYDCTGNIGGYTHLGLRLRLYSKYKHSFNIGVGPTIYYRQDWSGMTNYNIHDDETYKKQGSWQYAYQIINGEIEYNYILSKRADLSVSIGQNHLNSFTFMLGYRYWFTKLIKFRGDCNCTH